MRNFVKALLLLATGCGGSGLGSTDTSPSHRSFVGTLWDGATPVGVMVQEQDVEVYYCDGDGHGTWLRGQLVRGRASLRTGDPGVAGVALVWADEGTGPPDLLLESDSSTVHASLHEVPASDEQGIYGEKDAYGWAGAVVSGGVIQGSYFVNPSHQEQVTPIRGPAVPDALRVRLGQQERLLPRIVARRELGP